MHYRCYKKLSGEWLDVVFTSEEPFSVDESEHRGAVLVMFGLPAVAVVESENNDPRSGPLVQPLPPPPDLPRPPTVEQRIAALEAQVAAFGQQTAAAADAPDWLIRSKGLVPP